MWQTLRYPARHRQHTSAHRPQDTRPLSLDCPGVEQGAALTGRFQFGKVSLCMGEAGAFLGCLSERDGAG
jgi:hypothetical protein